MVKEQVKHLWQLCFDDSENFTELYFRLRYKEERNLSLYDNKKIIAALQLLPYPMTFCHSEVPTDYISGACTHPAYRNQGAMHRLLAHSFLKMHQNGSFFSTLIPAEPWLFDYYRRRGYTTIFRQETELFHKPDTFLPDDTFTFLSNPSQKEVYCYLNKKLHEHPCCIQHTEEDFQAILADLLLSNGTIYALLQHKHICAIAFAYPTEGSILSIRECLSDTPEMKTILLHRVCEWNHTDTLHTLTVSTSQAPGKPWGMIRIIRAEEVLRLYVTCHPSVTCSFNLVDEQLPANNGHYTLCNGHCLKSEYRQANDSPLWNIRKLAEFIFTHEEAYMSLMLDC